MGKGKGEIEGFERVCTQTRLSMGTFLASSIRSLTPRA